MLNLQPSNTIIGSGTMTIRSRTSAQYIPHYLTSMSGSMSLTSRFRVKLRKNVIHYLHKIAKFRAGEIAYDCMFGQLIIVKVTYKNNNFTYLVKQKGVVFALAEDMIVSREELIAIKKSQLLSQRLFYVNNSSTITSSIETPDPLPGSKTIVVSDDSELDELICTRQELTEDLDNLSVSRGGLVIPGIKKIILPNEMIEILNDLRCKKISYIQDINSITSTFPTPTISVGMKTITVDDDTIANLQCEKEEMLEKLDSLQGSSLELPGRKVIILDNTEKELLTSLQCEKLDLIEKLNSLHGRSLETEGSQTIVVEDERLQKLEELRRLRENMVCSLESLATTIPK